MSVARGPQVLTVDELTRTFLAAPARRGRIWPIPADARSNAERPGPSGPEHTTGRVTFAERRGDSTARRRHPVDLPVTVRQMH